MKIKDTHWFCRTIDIDVIGDINDSVLFNVTKKLQVEVKVIKPNYFN